MLPLPPTLNQPQFSKKDLEVMREKVPNNPLYFLVGLKEVKKYGLSRLSQPRSLFDMENDKIGVND